MTLRVAGYLVAWCGLAAPLAAQQTEELPPPGFGTLKVDDIALLFETADLRIRVMPLDERVLRLLASDSYASLSGIKRLKREAIDSVGRRFGVNDPSLFMISFFGLRDQATFTPEELTLESRGRFFRPLGFAPLSSVWGERRLERRGEVVAVALFDPGIALFDDLTVSYGTASTDAWSRIVRRLDLERAAVLSRAAAAGRS
ncbi:MAG TPA: hypothetical protein VFH97_08000 [Gemmatimonadales bacterium]|nr:hypothetical protein [Gemmatimonadales bacterium]